MASIESNPSLRSAILSSLNSTSGPGATDRSSATGSGVNAQGGPLPPSSPDNRFGPALAALFQPPGNLAESTERLANAENAPTLAEFETALKTLLATVRDPDMLAKLMIEMSSMSRQNALDSRLQARSQARSELEGQAAETRESAQKMLTAAIVGLAVAVVSFAISMVGAGLSMNASKNAASNAKDSIQANKIMDNADGLSDASKLKLTHQAGAADAMANIANKKAELINMLTSSLTGLMNAVKGTVEGGMNSAAKMDEAEGQMQAAAAQDSQANADMAKQFMDELQELIRSALQFLKDMQQAETDMMATASRL